MRSPLIVLAVLAVLLAPSPVVAAPAPPEPLTRQQLLTLEDYVVVYPDVRNPSRGVHRSPVFAPRGCDDQGVAVRGSSRIQGGLSVTSRRRSVSLIDQNLVRFDSVRQARDLVKRYRDFSKRCVGDVDTDDGEGGDVLLKNRAWFPPVVGDESAGMLIGWFSRGAVDWRRVLVVRTGRTVSVLDVSFTDVRPPQRGVLALGRLAVDRVR
ncbi:hypothetical protein [Nocardioides sp. zg-1230]|uniref:hypothetical protein n=1 Tax=Nocardioides sp. zg-1230 TaxID=2736601 RepID=UPI0015524071|nr:hypothetical protein [Nocardioides sp. zg-1230]NPC43402.1 hypothetical protein [Nocardioides sp. zg-1230]NPC44694.1 hypothetical protein [Nocardioides sp. zg-1230]